MWCATGQSRARSRGEARRSARAPAAWPTHEDKVCLIAKERVDEQPDGDDRDANHLRRVWGGAGGLGAAIIGRARVRVKRGRAAAECALASARAATKKRRTQPIHSSFIAAKAQKTRKMRSVQSSERYIVK